MKSFKIWFETATTDKDENKELKDIWSDTFDALGISGFSDEKAAQESLSNITFNSRGEQNQNSTFKGKLAALKRLENKQIFNRLENLSSPEIKKNVEETRKWLGQRDPGHAANASTTVSSLLEKLFGKETFGKFIDSDFPVKDSGSEPKAKVPPQPPKQDVSTPQPTPDNQAQPPMQPGPPATGMMGEQPPISGSDMPVQNPMPPKPAGAELGLF